MVATLSLGSTTGYTDIRRQPYPTSSHIEHAMPRGYVGVDHYCPQRSVVSVAKDEDWWDPAENRPFEDMGLMGLMAGTKQGGALAAAWAFMGPMGFIAGTSTKPPSG